MLLVSQRAREITSRKSVHMRVNTRVRNAWRKCLATHPVARLNAQIAALKRAERMVEKMRHAANEKSVYDPSSPSLLTSAAMGESVPAGSETDAHLVNV